MHISNNHIMTYIEGRKMLILIFSILLPHTQSMSCLCVVILWPCARPLKSIHYIISRQHPNDFKPMEKTEGYFKMFDSYAPFRVADFEAIISIFKVFWSTVLRIGWKGYVVCKTHSQPCFQYAVFYVNKRRGMLAYICRREYKMVTLNIPINFNNSAMKLLPCLNISFSISIM